MTRFELRYRNGIGRGICGVTGDNVDCWMEIQHGKGPWAPPVSGIVPLGSTLTLVVAINDYRGNEGNGESRNEICVFNFWIFFLFSFFVVDRSDRQANSTCESSLAWPLTAVGTRYS